LLLSKEQANDQESKGETQKDCEEEQVMFKPCAGCKTKMKCKKAGKCLGKMKAKPRRRK